MPVPIPPVITQPFGKNAVPGTYLQVPIPVTSVVPGRASMDLGFPPITMEPVVAGGIPPFGQDVNGILYTLSAYALFARAGQLFGYDADVVAATGGYSLGAVLGSADGSTIWRSIVNNNVTNPETGGAGWVAISSYGFANIGTSGGVTTANLADSSRNVIAVTGALVSNATLVLPATQQQWLIVNATTGAFSLTVKTAAGGGVNIPAGGYSAPVGVYGDGTNIYPSISPLSYPIAEAATPSTLALRTNVGYLLAKYFNSDNPVESFTADSFFAQSAGDGYLRKLSVAQTAAQLLAASAPAQSKTDNGYVQLPGGIILQWGFAQGAAGVGSLSFGFPITFPNACLFLTTQNGNRNGGSNGSYVNAKSTTGGTAIFDVQNLGAGAGFRGGYWLAIGF